MTFKLPDQAGGVLRVDRRRRRPALAFGTLFFASFGPGGFAGKSLGGLRVMDAFAQIPLQTRLRGTEGKDSNRNGDTQQSVWQ
ncbi:MAG: hypothetical protein ABIP48_29885 [Planctomycetota bacterium]